MEVTIHAGEFDVEVKCVGCKTQFTEPVYAFTQAEAKTTFIDRVKTEGWEDSPRGPVCPACMAHRSKRDEEEPAARRVSSTRSTRLLRRRGDEDED